MKKIDVIARNIGNGYLLLFIHFPINCWRIMWLFLSIIQTIRRETLYYHYLRNVLFQI